MPKTRGIRCSEASYTLVAIYAGKTGLSLCEALDRIAEAASGLASAQMGQGGLLTSKEGLKTRNVSDGAIARACGVDRRLIPRWRDGTHRPRNFDRVFLIAVGLAVVTKGQRVGVGVTPRIRSTVA